MDSILTTIKQLLGMEESYTAFDVDIITGINSSISTMKQIGLPVANDFMVINSEQKWGDLGIVTTDLQIVKILMYQMVRLTFDPPSNSALLQALQTMITEHQTRLQIQFLNEGE